MNEDLKPCPFCGGTPKLIPRGLFVTDGYRVMCVNCGYWADSGFETGEKAKKLVVSMWNRRTDNERERDYQGIS